MKYSINIAILAKAGQKFVRFLLVFGFFFVSIDANFDRNQAYYVDPIDYPEFSKLAKKFASSSDLDDEIRNQKHQTRKEVAAIWDAALKQVLEERRSGTLTINNDKIEQLPTHFMKSDIERLVYAERMKTVMVAHKMKHIGVAEKYVYIDSGKARVVARAVEQGDQYKKFSLAEVQEICTLAAETGFRDYGGLSNLLTDKQGKRIFIDTEKSSFYSGCISGDEEAGIPNNCKAVYVLNLKIFYNQMESDAQAWFDVRCDALLKSAEGIVEYRPLPEHTELDDSSIDMEKAIQEYKDFNENEPIKILAETGICKNGKLQGKWNGLEYDLAKSKKVRAAIEQAKSNGKKIDLSGSYISSLDLSGLDLSEVNFTDTEMSYLNLSGCKLVKSSFVDAVFFQEVDISGADASHADFRCWYERSNGLQGIDTAKLTDIKVDSKNSDYWFGVDNELRKALLIKSRQK